jgi:hypothetical protein
MSREVKMKYLSGMKQKWDVKANSQIGAEGVGSRGGKIVSGSAD